MEKLDEYSFTVPKLINGFKNGSAKSIDELVSQMLVLSDLLILNGEMNEYFLTTTFGCQDLDEMASILERFEKISEVAVFHSERMVTAVSDFSIDGYSIPGVKGVMKDGLKDPYTLRDEGSDVLKQKFESCQRKAPPRKRKKAKGESSDT